MQLHIKIIYGVLAVLLVCTIISYVILYLRIYLQKLLRVNRYWRLQIIQVKLPRMIFFLEENMEEQESVIAESQHQINSFDIIFQMP